MRDLHLGGGQSLVSQFSNFTLGMTVTDLANRGRSRLKRLRDIALTLKDSDVSQSSLESPKETVPEISKGIKQSRVGDEH